jgi:PAS domain S-box-containing protein
MPESGNASDLTDTPGKAEGINETLRQEVLLKTGALQNAIITSAHFSSIATDAQGVIQIFNVGAERMLGYLAADVLNKITPADISDPQEVIERAATLSAELGTPIAPGFEALVFKASRGIEDIYELTYICKDGNRLPAVVSVTALRDAQDAIIGYLLIGTDNTARKQVEAERQHLLVVQAETNKQLQQTNLILQISEERLAVTLNSIGDAVIATDADARVTLMNPLAEKLTGWTQAQASGRMVDEIIHIINKETRLLSRIPVMETLAQGTTQGMANHTILIARDGSECDIADSCAPIRDRDSQVIGAVLVFRDVTGEYAAQQALRESEARYRGLFDTIDEGFCIIELIYDQHEKPVDWRYLEVNPSFEKQTGISEVTGKRIRELAPAHEEYWFETYGKVALTGNPVRFINEAKAIDGIDNRWFDLYAFPAGEPGSHKVAILFTDITERKRLDQVLQDRNAELKLAKAVAEKANLAKSNFLSSMSHELRTPLNAILGFAQLLEAGSPPPTPSQTIRLHQIIKAGWYLLDLINEILDLAVIESGKLSLSLEPLSLSNVLLECEAMIGPQAQQRGINIIFDKVDPAWFAHADHTRVKQALINLLSNAIKYNREQGMVEVACIATPEHLRISIKDSGAGLPPDKLAQLFQPFNRLGQETGTEEGTGIGLVVTRQLVELMGGTVGVESTVGVGSEFWIELIRDVMPQLAAEHTMAAELAPQAQGNAPQRTLLYVEDNPANLMLVEQIIEGVPHVRMLSARDATLGIALARAHLPEVILMDINLPGISGIQALKILRENPATTHIPVLAVSANAMPRDIEKGLEAGFFRYLTKPIKINEFMDALDSALELAEPELDGAISPARL